MKIVILTVEHAYANYLTRKLVDKYGSEIKLIGYSDVLLHNKSFIDSLAKYYQVSGLQYIFNQAIKLQLYKIFQLVYFSTFPNNFDHKLYPANKLALKKGIKILHIKNINDAISVSQIKKIKPDVIISVYFNQILKDQTIHIAKKCVLNIHPGYLPNYKGVSPVFWSIANREKDAGVTIHYINEGIDTGEIIVRKKIRIEKNDTEDSLYWKLTFSGESLLTDIIDSIKKGDKIKTVKNKNGNYFSLPSRTAVKKYMKRTKSFFRIKQYLSKQ